MITNQLIRTILHSKHSETSLAAVIYTEKDNTSTPLSHRYHDLGWNPGLNPYLTWIDPVKFTGAASFLQLIMWQWHRQMYAACNYNCTYGDDCIQLFFKFMFMPWLKQQWRICQEGGEVNLSLEETNCISLYLQGGINQAAIEYDSDRLATGVTTSVQCWFRSQFTFIPLRRSFFAHKNVYDATGWWPRVKTLLASRVENQASFTRLDLDQIPVNVPVLMPKLGFNWCERGARNLFAHVYEYKGSNANWVVITTAYKTVAAAKFGIKLTIWCSWRRTWGVGGYSGS